MRPAFAAIPDTYMDLALRNDGWYVFVSLLAVLIHAMQSFERMVERLIIWPFIQIRRTIYHSDSLMVEFASAHMALFLAAWVIWGRDNSVAHQLMTQKIPEPCWVTVAILLSLAQFWSAAHGSINTRIVCSAFAWALWSTVSVVLMIRVGFSLAHVFSLPMTLACWLTFFMLIVKGQPNGPAATAE